MTGSTATDKGVCTGYAHPVDGVRTVRAVPYGPHDPAGNPPDTIELQCAGRFPLCGTPQHHPRNGSHRITVPVPPATFTLRERINTLAWIATNPEDDMARKAAEEEATYISGFCNPDSNNPMWSHERCLGEWRGKPCRCDKPGCPCNNRRLERIAAAEAAAAPAATPAVQGWTADEVADLMVELPTCPLCDTDWTAHHFTDTDRVECPTTPED